MKKRSLESKQWDFNPLPVIQVDIHPKDVSIRPKDVDKAVVRQKRQSIGSKARQQTIPKNLLPPISEAWYPSTNSSVWRIDDITDPARKVSLPHSSQRKVSLPGIQKTTDVSEIQQLIPIYNMWSYVFDSLKLPDLINQNSAFQTLSRQTKLAEEALRNYLPKQQYTNDHSTSKYRELQENNQLLNRRPSVNLTSFSNIRDMVEEIDQPNKEKQDFRESIYKSKPLHNLNEKTAGHINKRNRRRAYTK